MQLHRSPFASSVYENSMNVFYCSKSSEPSCKVPVSEADRAKSSTARWSVISAERHWCDWWEKSSCMWRLCTVQQFLLIRICFKIPLGGCVEPYKNCRVMSACFRFSIMTSSWSELAWVLRSVRRTMLRRLHFFPLNKTNKHSVT